MTRVGVITMPRVVNYGAALQAFALAKVIEKLGFCCQLIDYAYPNSYHLQSRRQKAAAWKARLRRLVNSGLGVARAYEKRRKRFERFVQGWMPMGSRRFACPEALLDDPPAHEVYVVGSDQVWNPVFVLDDPCFFLEFAPADARRVAYAPSFGMRRVPRRFHAAYKEYIEKLHFVSAREHAGAAFIERMTGRRCPVVLDPSLLLEMQEWRVVAVPFERPRPYLACYCLGRSRYVRALSSHVAQTMELDIIHVWPQAYDRFRSPGVSVYDAGPREFLGIMLGASFVVTNSYHGTALAANFGKPFLSVKQPDIPDDARLPSLALTLGTTERLLDEGAPLPGLDALRMDAAAVADTISRRRLESLAFLEEALAG